MIARLCDAPCTDCWPVQGVPHLLPLVEEWLGSDVFVLFLSYTLYKLSLWLKLCFFILFNKETFFVQNQPKSFWQFHARDVLNFSEQEYRYEFLQI